MLLTTTSTPPPFIIQRIRTALLNIPLPGEDANTLYEFFLYAQEFHKKKTKSGKIPRKEKEGIEFINQFLELYERIKTKEEEFKNERRFYSKGFFYHIGSIGKKGDKIFRRTKYRRRFYQRTTELLRRNNQIQETVS